MQVSLPDGKILELPVGATALDAAAAIGPRLAKDAIGARANGKLTDIFTALPDGATLEIITTKKPNEAIDLARHTLAHVMAQAILELYGDKGFSRDTIKMGIGPVIENGFYYDFDLPEALKFEELETLELKMREIIKRDLPLSKFTVSREQALGTFEGRDRYKTELIEGLPAGEIISFYRQGTESDFTDLCRGPHLPNTRMIGNGYSLTRLAAAYWRGSEKNPQLQRIYGTAWPTKDELRAYLERLAEAEKRDHRKLGAELDLFSFPEEIGSGLAVFHPRGGVIRKEMEDYSRAKHLEAGVEDGFHVGDRVQELPHPAVAQHLARHRDDHPLGGGQRIQGQHAQ